MVKNRTVNNNVTKSQTAKNKPGSGQVRIIAGQWRSRRLPIQDLEGLRPTTDRVRETLFNWLANDLVNARVLDCFGGSGALALEALSRYASFAKIIELQRSAAMQLKENLQTLKCDKAEVLNADTLVVLQRGCEQGFDVVFIDPPFRKGLAEKTIQLLDTQAWLNDGALIYVEIEAELTQLAIPPCWHALKEKNAGQVSYRLYQYQAENTAEPIEDESHALAD
ncbi:MAG: 16S rRNA (guanine(966)-N(2))-methyltransferase RsmD [Gammaproteobacteria bacterium]|uniref:16S rRNA (guanine(966)-N(2))-methyltransferase RsmD n=1 Tax=Shewanella hafniensis TaxID=365590 RepID=UPI001BBAACC1|nr:16S rRNA (guanine(966)-N(2))-methyltransferase RsmD [Shewanella hafniensis]MBU1392233.1 16S rRNA (guanine(966)-N(2))-methyltransferase RsmD [Gammaproteobacteria bacterium]MBU1478040.1 16S rRNA (guanine(966)-N(2))-methyltransferase RsmD [Gammaproteobacteria bacterium]MBU2000938.1 16S rRNA (guanine(966)-N(2))-methyltransferase RsmD [Gammaproteobacteria bacterium]MBU2132893.1 16S rRNA (guanine(966)-N(2))-methyltransferase RsmD [Gammaproteobacteria bacterium]MBU2186753.1 16S rRNA (guanine(966)-